MSRVNPRNLVSVFLVMTLQLIWYDVSAAIPLVNEMRMVFYVYL